MTWIRGTWNSLAPDTAPAQEPLPLSHEDTERDSAEARKERQYLRRRHIMSHDEEESEPGEWCPTCRLLDEP